MNESSSCSFTSDNIENSLPSQWKYKLLNKVVFGSPSKLEICIKVALFSTEEINEWVEALEEKVQCSYSIQTTRKCAGEKVLFKRRLLCQHKTRDKNSYPNLKTGTRNTNCPSRLSISLMRIQKKYRGKDPPDPMMPCIIDYVVTHNHSPSLSVRFRRVNRTVQDKLKRLFSVGYNASAAYEYIKVEIQLNNPLTYEDMLVNRSICPDRNFCHRWYNMYINEHGALNYADKTFLIKRIEEYNTKMGEECADIEVMGECFVIVLCPPLFKRVHQYVKASSEIVFVAAIHPADNDESKALFMSTYSECGALPLGIIIISSENSDLISKGLEMLRNIVGDAMFFGRKDGPSLFVVDDCEAEQIALNVIWPSADILFCVFHILYTLWRYLLCTRNGIHRNEGITFFKQFREIMVAATIEECDRAYNAAVISAEDTAEYVHVLEAYWERKDMWTTAYRNPSLHQQYKDILTVNDNETTVCLLKGSIFHRMRSFNVIQLVDFLSTKFVDYYTERLLDAANARLIRNMLRKIPVTIDTKKIEQVNKYLYFVPSIKVPNVNYAVNTEILACTCLKNNTGYICFHIGWLLTLSVSFQEKIECRKLRDIFHRTATGAGVPNNSPTLESATKYVARTSKRTPQVMEQVIMAGDEIIKVQVVEDEDEPDVNEDMDEDAAGIQTIIVDEEQAMTEGKRIIGELSNSLNCILEKAPFKVVPALHKLLVRTNGFGSVESFSEACDAYAALNNLF